MPLFSGLPPVPRDLIGFFRAGGARIALNLAERVGTGLQFINKLRQMFPRDPAHPYADYMKLLGYVNTFARTVISAGNQFRNLGFDEQLPLENLPRNYFVRADNSGNDRYMVRYNYLTVNESTGTSAPQSGIFWFDRQMTYDELLRAIQSKVQDKLDQISASHPQHIRYSVDTSSISITSALRRY